MSCFQPHRDYAVDGAHGGAEGVFVSYLGEGGRNSMRLLTVWQEVGKEQASQEKPGTLFLVTSSGQTEMSTWYSVLWSLYV